MPTKYHSVYSSDVAEIGYNSESGELHVIWQNGNHSVYEGVPQEVYEAVGSASSVGSALYSQVKKIYPHHYSDDMDDADVDTSGDIDAQF